MNLLPLRARRWLRRTFAPDREHRVDFLIAGAQKGGTNTLDFWLRSHPAIAMAERKEVRYFNDDRLHSDGNPDYAYYHAWFARSAFERMTGEASPVYLYWKPTIARIHQYNPAMKFILLLRDPVDRAYSSWNMQRQRGVESRSFEAAVADELPRLFDPTHPSTRSSTTCRAASTAPACTPPGNLSAEPGAGHAQRRTENATAGML